MSTVKQPQAELLRDYFAQLLHMEFCEYSQNLPEQHRRARLKWIEQFPTSSNAVRFTFVDSVPPFDPSTSETAHLLNVIVAAMASGDLDNKISTWIDFFQQRFEVSKGLFSAYPALKGERALLIEATPYACLALALLTRFTQTGRHSDISTAFKILDLLASAEAIKGSAECPELLAALKLEQLVLGGSYGA